MTKTNDLFVIYYKVENLSDYYTTDHNGFKYANDNYKIFSEEILNKYSYICKDINNKGIVLTNSDIEFSRKKYDNFASCFYDTKIPRDILSKKGITIC